MTGDGGMGYVVEVGEIETGIWGGLGDVPYILVAHDKAAVFFCFSVAGVKGDDFRMVGFNGIFYTIIPDSVTSEVKSFLVFCFEEDAHGIPAGMKVPWRAGILRRVTPPAVMLSSERMVMF